MVILSCQAARREGATGRTPAQRTGESAFESVSIAETAQVARARTACATASRTGAISRPWLRQSKRREACPVGTGRVFVLVLVSVSI